MERLYAAGALVSFVIGLGLTDAAIDAFWPQWNDVTWIRLAGGFSGLVFVLSLKLLRKVLSVPPP
jgi:hypothetical protein